MKDTSPRDLTPVLPRRVRPLFFLMTALLALGACAGFGLGDSATATLPGSNGYILPAVALLSAVLIACCPWRAVALIGQLALIASLLSGYLPEPLPADLGTGLGSLAALLTLALPLALFAKGGPRSTALRRTGLGLSLALGGAFLLSLALSFAPADISRGTLAALTLLSAIGTLRCRCGENELAAIAEDSAAATPRPFAAAPFGIGLLISIAALAVALIFPGAGLAAVIIGGLALLALGRQQSLGALLEPGTLSGIILATGLGGIYVSILSLSILLADDAVIALGVSPELLLYLGMLLCAIGCTAQLRRRSALLTSLRVSIGLTLIALILLTAPELLTDDLALACTASLLVGATLGGLLLFLFGESLSRLSPVAARPAAVALVAAFLLGHHGLRAWDETHLSPIAYWTLIGLLSIGYCILCLRRKKA